MRLLIISNRLPVTISKNAEGLITYNKSIGGLATGISTYLESKHKQSTAITEYLWIGWAGSDVDPDEQEDIKSKMLSEYNAYPVFINHQELDKYYDGFCNKTLWPLFHYFTAKIEYNNEFWDYYNVVNKKFCETTLGVVKPDDIIWIHDYQLMLLPRMLKEKLEKTKIGFFLHIPFPNYETFQVLPRKWSTAILEGLLGSDLIGFHTYDYEQYFLRCVFRILGYEHNLGKIIVDQRLVKVDTFPMGIDFQKFYTGVMEKETLQEKDKIQQEIAKYKIILSIDRLDYSKGILNRLQGFEKFLEINAQWHEQVVLVLVVVPSRTDVDEYQRMKRQIDEYVGKINGRFGKLQWTPIMYQFTTLNFHQLVAYYSVSDVALVTPLRDGMNLIAKEYLASKTDQTGVLILSMMAGAAQELGEAIQINPNYIEDIAEAILIALELPQDEQKRRNTIMQQRLKQYDVVRWADYFIEALFSINDEQEMFNAKLLTVPIKEELVKHYLTAHQRLILLDYDGTLVPYTQNPGKAIPSKYVLALVKALTEKQATRIVLISGRDKKSFEEWFSNLDLDIAAEHGVWIKEGKEEWRLTKPMANTWKEKIASVMETFVDRLPGSFVEEKEYSIVWHYRKSNPELASVRVKELMNILVTLTANVGVQVTHGNKYIEVRNVGIDKGTAGLYFMSKYSPDFVLAIGDDWVDEDLFKALPAEAYTIRIGVGSAYARFHIYSYQSALGLLEQLIKE